MSIKSVRVSLRTPPGHLPAHFRAGLMFWPLRPSCVPENKKGPTTHQVLPGLRTFFALEIRTGFRKTQPRHLPRPRRLLRPHAGWVPNFRAIILCAPALCQEFFKAPSFPPSRNHFNFHANCLCDASPGSESLRCAFAMRCRADPCPCITKHC